MKLSGVFSNVGEDIQPSCNPEELDSALMMAIISKRMADRPHRGQLFPSLRIESANATPCADATAPSLDVEIPDHNLYHFPHLRHVPTQEISSEQLNGTPEDPNSKQNDTFPVGEHQQHQSTTKDGRRLRFLPLTSPPRSPRRENALPKAILDNVTSPDVPTMGSPSAWKWTDRNHRYRKLDRDIDTASDTESDSDLALARSPAKINPVADYNVSLSRDRKGKDRVVPLPAMRDTSFARNSPSSGSEIFTFADMPYSLPLSREPKRKDNLEKADSVTSITAVVDESEDLASRDGPYRLLVPLLWDGSEQCSVGDATPVKSTAAEMDGSEDYAALGDMPYNVPLSRNNSGQDKLRKVEPVTPDAKLTRPLSDFMSLAQLVESASSADPSMRTTSSCAITTHDSPCYAPLPTWPKLHIREDVALESDTKFTVDKSAWFELPFDPDVNMKHTFKPLSPTKAQKSEASNKASWPESSLSALPYRLKSSSPSELTNPRVETWTKDDLASFEIHDESKDISLQHSGTMNKKTINHLEIEYESSHSSEIATESMQPWAEELDHQSAISSPDRKLSESDKASNEPPTPSEGLLQTVHRPSEYLPAVFKVTRIVMPERETLDEISDNATKGNNSPGRFGAAKTVPKAEHAFTAVDQSTDLTAEKNWRYWMDDSIDHSRDGFPPPVDSRGVPFEHSPARMDRFVIRHYGSAEAPAWEDEDGVADPKEGVEAPKGEEGLKTPEDGVTVLKAEEGLKAPEGGIATLRGEEGLKAAEDGVMVWDDEVKKRVAEHLLKVVYDLEGLAGQAAKAA